MSPVNSSHSHPSTFILTGIPGLETAHIWISLPFCGMYIMAFFGNLIILYVVKTEQSLHGPMYYFLSMLAVTDMVLSTSVSPKMLTLFWFHSKEIDYDACLIQLFFVHCFSSTESGVFLAMAIDRYVAICNPLRHSVILSNPIITRIGLIIIIRGVLLISPFCFLLNRLQFCSNKVILHSYCEHMAVAKLACSNTIINAVYGLIVAFLVVGFDVTFIILSYVLILKVVFRLPSKVARIKAFSTCGSHICVILAFYIPALFTFLTHRFGHNVPLHIHIIIANLYLLVPPMFNPIVYGVKTKQIRSRVLAIFQLNRLF
ncbi:LOW QUALITY PROTEIN: olfactory receptor 52R1-like [Microcaecilia unicolor]|uniref:LOW QUALITY PROTEIN: olfactory receptor 52R1-like n=1 Tax=Microcaecilia unicolor TaxID=1415580 RepID=A0A6P7XRX2_9AMPH|nr:LOW QUALITY PROTEIN: olfactory receptor 52R1-like [Microcaecilia unicolor]